MSRQGIPRSCMIVLLILFQVTKFKNEEKLSKKKKLFSVHLREPAVPRSGGFPAAGGAIRSGLQRRYRPAGRDGECPGALRVPLGNAGAGESQTLPGR